MAPTLGLVNYRVHADRQKIIDALQGRLTDHHRFLLRMHLAHVRQLDADIEMLDLKTDQQLEPLRTQLQLLKTIPGVDTVAAHVLLAEIGADMSRFPSAGHLVSWAGLCPRNEKSAGKSFNTRIRNGNPWLKATLLQAQHHRNAHPARGEVPGRRAQAMARIPDCYTVGA
jgi:transposase